MCRYVYLTYFSCISCIYLLCLFHLSSIYLFYIFNLSSISLQSVGGGVGVVVNATPAAAAVCDEVTWVICLSPGRSPFTATRASRNCLRFVGHSHALHRHKPTSRVPTTPVVYVGSSIYTSSVHLLYIVCIRSIYLLCISCRSSVYPLYIPHLASVDLLYIFCTSPMYLLYIF